MLDLFPAQPLAEGAYDDDWTETHRLFDLSALRRTRYCYTDEPDFRSRCIGTASGGRSSAQATG